MQILDMNMTYPETSWEYTSENEAQRVVFVARMIQSYFYQKKGFNVLPELASKSVNAIYFPNLPIVHHQYFWEKIKGATIVEDKLSADILGQLLLELPHSTPPFTIRKEWKRIESNFWNTLQMFLPEVSSNVKKLVIRQTAFGSKASSVNMKKKKAGVITIYLRFDADVSHIASAIFLATLSHLTEYGILKGFTWEEQQSIDDFLLCHTSLAQLFPKHESTILSVRKGASNEIKDKSKQYLTELGFPQKQLFELDAKKQVTVNNRHFPLRLKEQYVLSLLIEKRNQIVSADDIASRLWEENTENHYSLYAISKVIERLRKQVQLLGIYPGIIETKRGQGFILND